MDLLIRELIHLGLSEKEAAVYVAALQLGPSPVQDISKLAKVNRATTYVMIEMLEKRGLLSSSQKDKKRIFIAEAPDRLLSLLRLQKKELDEKEGELTKLLPKLNAIFNRSGEKPEVRYFEGMEGLEALRRDFEGLEGETVQIVGYDAFTSVIEHETTAQHRGTLTKHHAKVRVLFVTKQSLEQMREQFWKEVDLRVVPPDQFPFKVEGEITVRADRVHMFTYAMSPLAVAIHSTVLADTFRAIFEMAWSGADR